MPRNQVSFTDAQARMIRRGAGIETLAEAVRKLVSERLEQMGHNFPNDMGRHGGRRKGAGRKGGS